MAKLIRCECGFVARGDSDDQVVGVIRGHMASDHPAILATVSREDLLGWYPGRIAGWGHRRGASASSPGAQENVSTRRTSRLRNTGGPLHSLASFSANSPVSGRPELAMASW